MSSNKINSGKSSTHLIGGFLGGLTSATCLQPLDLLKTRIQQSGNSSLFTSVKEIKNPLELWRGTLPSALRTSIGSALYLTCLNKMRTYISVHNHLSKNGMTNNNNNNSTNKTSSLLPSLTNSENLITGAVSRGLVGYLTMPITILKVRYESTFYQYNSIWHATKDILHNEGMIGFFKGFGPTCLRDAPYAGLYMLFYERSKLLIPNFIPKFLISYDNNRRNNYSMTTSTIINSSSAIVAASVATTITAPFDTIKTRMQLYPKQFKNSIQTMFHIILKERSLNLFSGLSMRLTRKALSAGIAWGIYESMIKSFN